MKKGRITQVSGPVVDVNVILAPSSIRVPPSSTLTQEDGLALVLFSVTLSLNVSVPPVFTVNMQDASELIVVGFVALTVTFPFISIEFSFKEVKFNI